MNYFLNIKEWIAIDKNEKFIQYFQSNSGRLLIFFVAFFLILSLHSFSIGRSLLLASAAAGCAYATRFRGIIFLAAAAVIIFYDQTGVITDRIQKNNSNHFFQSVINLKYLIVVFQIFVCFVFATVLIYTDRKVGAFIIRRPLQFLLLLFSTLTVLAILIDKDSIFYSIGWIFVLIFSNFIWFMAYALVDRRISNKLDLPMQLGLFGRFWGSSSTPMGKGAAFLLKVSCKNNRELAVTQIKGVKLLIWALVLLQLQKQLEKIIVTGLRLPDPQVAIEALRLGQPFSIGINWSSVIWGVINGALLLSVWGHKAVAIGRLAGYKLPRNTYKPFAATTLVEFWNRYYFYFKELLVEFFFIPTFLRTFRKHPRLRLFFATFMAAGVGNAIYHFARDIYILSEVGVINGIQSYTSYLFYCLVLAIGIAVSQVRNSATNPDKMPFLSRILSMFSVWFFFVLISVFGNESRVHDLGDRLSFVISLFGVRL